MLGLSGAALHCSLEEHPTDRCNTDSDCLGRRYCVDGACQVEPGESAGGSAGTGEEAGQAGSIAAAAGMSGAGPDDSVGAGGSSTAGGDPEAPTCKNAVALQGFCIDGEEVTRRSYQAWLDREPSPLLVHGCEENLSLEPGCDWPGFETGEDWAVRAPATCIDWCDAYAYCAAFDSHLCGAIEGGAASAASIDDSTESEWFAACSGSDGRDYPYGDEFRSGFCVDASAGELRRVDSKAACRGTTFPNTCIVDLSGNAAEWENSCDSDAPDAQCRVRGGSYLDDEEGVSCRASATRGRMDNTDPSVGFRCCRSHCEQ